MNPEIFALCTPGTTDYSDIVSGGVPVITASDVAAGIANVRHRGAEKLLMLKWMGMESEREPLKRIAVVKMSDWWRKETMPRPGLLYDMALLAIHEVVDPRKCPACQGAAYRKHKTCDVCRGSGRACNPDYCHLLELTLEQWQTWQWRYARVLKMLLEWEAMGILRVREALE